MSLCLNLQAHLHMKAHIIQGQIHMPNDNLVSHVRPSPVHCFLRLISNGCHEVSVELAFFNSFICLPCLRAFSIELN